MELTIAVDTLLTNAPTTISVTVAVLSAIYAGYLKYRKVDIEDKTSVSSIQSNQVKSLMDQITLLSDELVKTRTQLTELHEQNIHLMEELREANRRIGELEDAINKKSHPPTSTEIEGV